MDILETSPQANIWTERFFIIILMMATAILAFVHPSLFQYFEAMLLFFLFAGIFFLGFAAIAAHIIYYFRFEKRRKVELHPDKMVINVNDQEVEQVFRNEIIKITLCDQRRDGGNSHPTLLNDFYYLVVTGKIKQRVVLTCLLDIRLKKKITEWWGKELQHRYQFFPFP